MSNKLPHTEKLLKRLRRNASLAMYAHFGAAERNIRYHIWLGVPVLIINLVLGSVLATYIGTELPGFFKWISAVLSLTAAILTALLTFFHFDSGKQKHREIANKYLSLERKAEKKLAEFRDGLLTLEALAGKVDWLNEAYEKVNQEASNYPTNENDYQRAKNKIESRELFLDSLWEEINDEKQDDLPVTL